MGSSGCGVSPLDLQRLAARIERLHRQQTHGWHPADALQLRNVLHGRDPRRTLPKPETLREWAEGFSDLDEDTVKEIRQSWRNWLAWALRAEGWVRDNDPRNPRKMIRDIQRGKFPPFR